MIIIAHFFIYPSIAFPCAIFVEHQTLILYPGAHFHVQIPTAQGSAFFFASSSAE